jgi:hypothetical protein
MPLGYLATPGDLSMLPRYRPIKCNIYTYSATLTRRTAAYSQFAQGALDQCRIEER